MASGARWGVLGGLAMAACVVWGTLWWGPAIRPAGEAAAQRAAGLYGVDAHHFVAHHRSARHAMGAPKEWAHLPDALAACGQRPQDPLVVAVVDEDGRRPWEVDVAVASPGAEACVAEVLSRAPIGDGPSLGEATYLGARFTLADLRRAGSVEQAAPHARCRTFDPAIGGWLEGPMLSDLPATLSCGPASGLTRVEVVYRQGALVEVGSDPATACVEERMRASRTAPPPPWTDRSDEVRCSFDVVLGGA